MKGPAAALDIADSSVDCVVMDPPYYDNVMYAELSDFFYVWLKRTAGLLYPELFTGHLTDKDREAVANAAKFAGQKGGAKNLAGRDYQRRMASIFKEQRRVLKPDGIMTVMFTHKAAGAWDALAGGSDRGWLHNHRVVARKHRGGRQFAYPREIRRQSPPSSWSVVCARQFAENAEIRLLGRGGADGPSGRPLAR